MKTIKLTLKRLFFPALFTFILLTIIDLYEVFLFTTPGNSRYGSIATAFLHGRSETLLTLIVFVLLPVALSWVFYSDKKKNYIDYISMRISRRKYFYLVLLTTFFVTFFIIFLKERTVYYYMMHRLQNYSFGDAPISGYLFQDLMILKPYWFCLFMSFWTALTFAIYVNFSVIVSLVSDSYFLISTAPILYRYILDAFIVKAPFYPIGSYIFVQGFPSFYGEYVTIPSVIISLLLFVIVQIVFLRIGMRKLERNES